MKKFTKAIALIAAITLILTVVAGCGTNEQKNDASSEATQTVKFGTNAEFAPFEFVADEGKGIIEKFDGIDINIAKLIGDDNGFKPEIVNIEFDSLLIAIQNGQIDAIIAAMTVTDERKEVVDFSEPYYTATQVMIVKESSDITKATDMADKKIAVIQGYTGETCVDEMGYKYESFKKGSDAVEELKNDKADVVVIDKATADSYIKQNTGLKIVEDSSAFESEQYAIAVKKGNTELLNKINASIKKMLADGTINDLAAKYTNAIE